MQTRFGTFFYNQGSHPAPEKTNTKGIGKSGQSWKAMLQTQNADESWDSGPSKICSFGFGGVETHTVCSLGLGG